MKARQTLRVVEAAYRIADGVEGWIAGVLEAATPLLDRGGGLQGYSYEVAAGKLVLGRRIVETASTPPGFSDASLDTCARIPAPLVPGLFCTAPAIDSLHGRGDALSLRDSSGHRPFEIMSGFGMRDMMSVVAYDPTGAGLLVCAPSERVLAPLDPRTVSCWEMLRAHLLSGLRLQRALGNGSEPDAVIEPSGRVVHAEQAARGRRARDALRRRAIEVDRTRGSAGRRDPMGALQAWTALVDGTWSLTDVFDTDGRRYFIARRNDPRLTLPRPLSDRERQVLAFAALGYSNKQIAYALGLAPSTISSHLRAGMQRIGSQDVAALADIFGVRGSYEASA